MVHTFIKDINDATCNTQEKMYVILLFTFD